MVVARPSFMAAGAGLSTTHIKIVKHAGNGSWEALSVGNFNGDGAQDIAMGAPYEDVNGVISAGVVRVFYGSRVGISSQGEVWHQNSPSVQHFAEKLDQFGRALSSGDFNGDAISDLVVGVPWEEIGSKDAGIVQVLYGTPSGITAAGDQVWHQDKRGVLGVAENFDSFGSGLIGDRSDKNFPLRFKAWVGRGYGY